MVEALKQQLGDRAYLCISGQWLPRTPRIVSFLGTNPANWLPRSISRWRGFARTDRTAAILDNSGFQYGDPWAELVPQMEGRLQEYTEAHRQGAKVILVPQAFGPFQLPATREYMRRLFEVSDLLFARDRFSHQHLQHAGCPEEKIAVAPDFSVLVEGQPPTDNVDWSRRVGIVPNMRMTDRTPPAIAHHYHAFLVDCITQVRARGFEPLIIVHEKHDLEFVQSLRTAAGFPVEMVDASPVESKGILGACHAVIGSRFHSLIGSLSQAVPTLGTVWTHKYQALFEEYEVSECLLHDLSSPEAVEKKMALLFDEASRRDLITRLERNAARHKERVRAMWTQVERLIFA